MRKPRFAPAQLARVVELVYVYDWSRPKVRAMVFPDAVDDTIVSQALREARNRHVVDFDIDEFFALRGAPNDVLRDDLFRPDGFDLTSPLVIDIEARGEPDPKEASLHTTLANHASIRLSELDGSKTRFFVAGGRTIVQVARMLKRLRPQWTDSRVDPLSGRNWTGSWRIDGSDFERLLDADDAARYLVSAVQRKASFSQIGHPLYAENAAQAQSIMREYCAFRPDGSWNWNDSSFKFSRAICGVGSLHPESGHRIMGFLESYIEKHYRKQGLKRTLKQMIDDGTLGTIDLPSDPDPTAPYLSRVALQLRDALSFAQEHNLGYFGDIANRLFPCLPIPKELPPDLPNPSIFVELLDKLDALNHRAIVMNWSHLRNVQTWVTAGGKHKHRPIWTLAITRFIERKRGRLENSILDQLTTDTQTATMLKDALEDFKRANDRVQQWYSDLTEILFQDDAFDRS